jgi:hypothetical protein
MVSNPASQDQSQHRDDQMVSGPNHRPQESSSMVRTVALAGLVALLLALAAGCGSSNSARSAASGGPSNFSQSSTSG